MQPDYLTVQTNDSNADAILCQMLPDYKAEIRRNYALKGKGADLNFNIMPIVAEAEGYLRRRLVERQQPATQSHHAIVKNNRLMLEALMAIRDHEAGGPDPLAYAETVLAMKEVAEKVIAKVVGPQPRKDQP